MFLTKQLCSTDFYLLTKLEIKLINLESCLWISQASQNKVCQLVNYVLADVVPDSSIVCERYNCRNPTDNLNCWSRVVVFSLFLCILKDLSAVNLFDKSFVKWTCSWTGQCLPYFWETLIMCSCFTKKL